MALTDVVGEAGNAANASRANRGNGGTLTDALGRLRNSNYSYIRVPAAAEVQSGVQFGLQGTQYTGSYTGGGATPTYSRGRVVNASA